MKDFLYEIKTRLGRNFCRTFWGLIKLSWQIIRHKDFAQPTSSEQIDVVILTVEKDFAVLPLVIDSLKNIGNKINKIFIVAPIKESIINFCQSKNIIFVDELSVLGFGKESLKSYTVNGLDRRGWLFQQFLKYGMKDLVEQENYLVLDSDTVLLNTVTFLENNKFVLFKNTEWHKPYFEAFHKIFGYKNKSYTSFTSHMMIFSKTYLNEMLKEIEEKGHDKWYDIIQEKIDKNKMSAVSDYENYGQWIYIRYPKKIIEKPLYNLGINRDFFINNLKVLSEKYGKRYKTISFHSWIKK